MEQITSKSMQSLNTKPLDLSAYVYSGYSQPDHNIWAPTKYDVYTDYWHQNTKSSVGAKCYNTGKVLIGCRYEPPPYREESAYALKLQRALLEEHTERRTIAASDLALYLVAAIAFIVIYLTR